MTKVLFVEPQGAYSNVFDKFMTIPLLGPVYLATIARGAGFDASIINENILGRKIFPEELQNIDILGLSCITATVNRGREIAKQFKALNPNGRTLIGGIHASMAPEDVKNDFDQVITGEAENIIVEILSGNLEDKIISGSPIQDLDSLPFPDFNLIKGWNEIKTKRWPVSTSRGCRYSCNFCSVTPMFGRMPRTRSSKSIMQEISRYKEGNLFIIDDHFAVDYKETFSLLEAMISSGFNLPWSAQVRTNVTKHPEIIAKMQEAGCFMLYFGFESPDPESLKEIQKSQTVEDITRSIRICHENDIKVHGMFMLGADSDNLSSFKLNIDFAKQQGIDFVQYSILTPLPGTALYRKLEAENRLLHKKWQYYDGLHVVSRPLPEKMSPYDLQQGLKDCYQRFYSFTNGIKIGVKAFFTRDKNYYPYFPAAMRFIGKKIVSNWLKHNKSYLNYLESVS